MLIYIVEMRLIKNFGELAKTPQRRIVLELIEEGLSAIQPENVIEKNVSLTGTVLNTKGQTFDLLKHHRIFILGFGKGSASISKIIGKLLGEQLTEGFVIDVEVPDEPSSKIKYTKGTHPLPSQVNLDFTKNVVERFENKLSEKDLVLVVVTGGGSALFELPKDLSLEELISRNEQLLKSGLTISQMNEERKKLSRVKGGGLAKVLHPAKVLGLIFSDVPGNDLSVIASGPTERGINTSEDKYFENVSNILMLSNQTALSAMEKKALELAVPARIYSDRFQGDAKDAGIKLINEAKVGEILLIGGETTVKVTGNGIGGRNLEVVLNSLSHIAERAVVASFDSDGWDNCEAAGAIGDLQTVEEAKKQNLNIDEFLQDNNSLEFFQKTGDAIFTGRLPSNISDIIVVYKKLGSS